MPLALLQVANSQLGYFVTPQSTSQQEGEQGLARACPSTVLLSGACQSAFPLFGRQPVAQSDSQFLYALDAPDTCGHIRGEEATLCRLVSQTANCPKPEVRSNPGPNAGTRRCMR